MECDDEVYDDVVDDDDYACVCDGDDDVMGTTIECESDMHMNRNSLIMSA